MIEPDSVLAGDASAKFEKAESFGLLKAEWQTNMDGVIYKNTLQ